MIKDSHAQTARAMLAAPSGRGRWVLPAAVRRQHQQQHQQQQQQQQHQQQQHQHQQQQHQQQQHQRGRRRGVVEGWRRWILTRGKTTVSTRVFIVAGEPSGDAIGGRLLRSLRLLSPDPLELSGVGGPLMEKQGLLSIFQMEDLSVMGTVELIPHFLRLSARLRATVGAAVKFRPDVVITVDTKGFSFRVLKRIKDEYARLGQPRPPTVHYVSPSFWAWKGGEERLKGLTEIVDLMLCILPFEQAACEARGLASAFVGHPILEDAHSVARKGESPDHINWEIKGDGAFFRRLHGIHPEAVVLSVLPGSRLQEVRRMLPIFEDALHLLSEQVQDLVVVIPTVHDQSVAKCVRAAVMKWKLPVVILPGASDTEKYNAFAASNAGLCTSGTAVMQLLLARTPCVVAYRAHPLTEWIARRLTKMRFISLPNILLNSGVIPEVLFTACTATELLHRLLPLLEDKSSREMQRKSAEQVLRMLAPSSLNQPPNGVDGALRRNTRLPLKAAGQNEGGRVHARPSAVAAAAILGLVRERTAS